MHQSYSVYEALAVNVPLATQAGNGGLQNANFFSICFYLGIFLLLVVLVLLITGVTNRFPQEKQVIRIAGLGLEVNLITFLLLLSAAGITVGIWQQLRHIDETTSRLDSLQKENDNLRSEYESIKNSINRMETEAYLIFPKGSKPNLEAAKRKNNPYSCQYKVSGGDPVQAEMKDEGESIRIVFKNLSRGTTIDWIKIYDSQANEEWTSTEEIRPLVRQVQMTKPQTP